MDQDVDEFIKEVERLCAHSNRSAVANRNLYPIQEQISLRHLWRYSPEAMSGSGVWKLNEDLEPDEFVDAFLRMFADKSSHDRVRRAIASQDADPADFPSRIRGCLDVVKRAHGAWDEQRKIPHILTTQSGRAFSEFRIVDDCEELFGDPEFEKHASFAISESVYKAKLLNVLFPDLCIAYDNRSRRRLRQAFALPESGSYLDLLKLLNKWIRGRLGPHPSPSTLLRLRRADRPGEVAGLKIAHANISLPPIGLTRDENWSCYTPAERPLSRVLDKQFYDLETDAVSSTQPPFVNQTQTFLPLSGKGTEIQRTDFAEYQEFRWGSAKFQISNDQIQDILKFLEVQRPLGASITNPPAGGLGEFLVSSGICASEKFASAIAAALKYDDLIEVERGRTFMLRTIE